MSLYCSSCGKELDKDAAFCRHCGSKVLESVREGGAAGPKRKVGVIRIISSFVVAVAVVFLVYAYIQSRKSPPKAQVAPPPEVQQLVNDVITVPDRGNVHYSFTLNQSALLTGDFRAFGGAGNDIIVLVLGADSYVNWSNGHQVVPLYDSGQVTVGNISMRLAAGKYYLVFDNGFSVLTKKSVEAHLKLISG